MISAIPSPPQGAWQFGPFTLRAYAICIIIGIFVAIWLGERRLRERGGPPGVLADIAVWAVPFGIVGGRIYHVLSSPDAYFGPGGDPMLAFQIWKGGLGIWGAVALGAVGVYIACRRRGMDFFVVADAVAPGVAFAQAIGRIGNYFNQELFGAPTTLPWGLVIDAAHRPQGYADVVTYHPTFLYELLWNIGVGCFLIVVGNRFRWSHGQVFTAYLCAYTVGRWWIEMMRIDPAELVLGVRLNVWTSGIVFAIGAIGFYFATHRKRAAIAHRTVPRGVSPGHATADVVWHDWPEPEHTWHTAPADPADRATTDPASADAAPDKTTSDSNSENADGDSTNDNASPTDHVTNADSAADDPATGPNPSTSNDTEPRR